MPKVLAWPRGRPAHSRGAGYESNCWCGSETGRSSRSNRCGRWGVGYTKVSESVSVSLSCAIRPRCRPGKAHKADTDGKKGVPCLVRDSSEMREDIEGLTAARQVPVEIPRMVFFLLLVPFLLLPGRNRSSWAAPSVAGSRQEWHRQPWAGCHRRAARSGNASTSTAT
jgi:hypothetical protein